MSTYISKSHPMLAQPELDNLRDLVENEDMTDSLLTGAYILLDDFTEAALHYDKLPAEKQEELAKYPIYNLWKNGIYAQ